ncbi:imidazolonepropionase [Mechercharimyces sp. CAU 1602]|uniref:imidazolonepropionase n=1 Tax=Mechercharimyces sp. CAU 1602 TaxID=2973933 RepID=UPI0021612CEE|nr:imidazolonepropionase [Mechercharimyces sp. CAU 1602]MCS1351930.1 imidazolonepropionase [Mechercharimyces sp. CAU 1602]
MAQKRVVIKRAGQLLTLAGASKAPKRKEEMNELGLIENGAVAIEGGRILAVGTQADVEGVLDQQWGSQWHTDEEIEQIDADGRLVMPGLVDPHTHLVFGGTREYELEMRLNGAKYLDILAAGGGILASTRMTRAASEEDLIEQSTKRLDQFLKHGVTTVEAKSGYGLTLEDELKQLRVAKRLGEQHPVDVISTFMGAHAIPPEYKGRSNDYVDLVIEEMLPIVAGENLASFCDVFCEEGVFTIEQSERILEAGKKVGLTPKVHADEIVALGGAELAARVGAISADHLLRSSDEGIVAMAEAGVIAVLLPGTAFFLMAEYARARDMIEAGVPVALSTDRNPGSSPTESLWTIMNLACLNMRMTPAEVITAATINAAHAIGKAEEVGSLEVGKKADLLMMDAPNYPYLQYNFGVNLVDTVVKNGQVFIRGGQRV